MISEELKSLKEYARILLNGRRKSGCSLALVKYANRIGLTKDEIIDTLRGESAAKVFYHCFEKHIIEEEYAPFSFL